MFSKKILLLSCLIATSCGYRFQYDYPEGVRPTLAIPFIMDDEDGAFTAAIISCVQASGIADVTARKGDFRLDVKMLQTRSDQIGYRRDPQKIKQQIQKNLLAAEQRKTLDIEVTLYRGETDDIAYGPYSISAFSDYDFIDGDSYQDLTFVDGAKGIVEVPAFSLGQLEAIDSAREAATSPLYRKLAQKIVDVISSEW